MRFGFYFLQIIASLVGLLICTSLAAQLCNGSLGDPVVNINFGSSNSSLSPPGSNLTFTGISCPNDGFYTLTSATSNCFNNVWHTLNNDHTGGGNFMLVNASYQPSDFFVSRVSNLCPNTTYEFAAWLANVFNRNGIRPNISFSIETPDGLVLARYDTGDIPENASAEWKQYGFYFTTPANNAEIILRMKNNAPGGIGNDIALDDITFRPCGAKVQAGIQNETRDTINVCKGNMATYILHASISTAYRSPVYQWQVSTDNGVSWKDVVGATASSFVRQAESKPGNYWYRVAITESEVAQLVSCRIASNIVAFNVHAYPIVDAGPDRVVLKDNSTNLNANIVGSNVNYSWSPNTYLSNATTLSPSVTPADSITYTLSASSIFGCTAQDQVSVKVVSGFFIPTAFTPDKDGKNDEWRIPSLDPDLGAEVLVYNRFGKILYHSLGGHVSWDGKWNGQPQPIGTYIYMVRFRNSTMILKGSFVLIR